MKLREYQSKALTIINEDLDYPEPVLLQAITGSGKTVMIARLINNYYLNTQRRFLILAHKRELVVQFYNTFKGMTDVPLEDIGIVCAGLNKIEIDKRVTIGTIQSFINQVDQYEACNLLVIDEAHKVLIGSDSQYDKVINMLKEKNQNTRIFGCTSTPFRLGHGYIYGDKCLESAKNLFPKLNHKITYAELEKSGYLMPLTGKVAANESLASDIAEVSVSGDFVLGQLGATMSKGIHLETAVEAIKQYCGEFKRICVFACTINHAKMLKELIGDECTIVHSELTEIEREMNMLLWKQGKKRIITSVNILVEGFDFPPLDCLDDETEILTPDGWKCISDSFENVIAVDTSDMSLKISNVEARVEKESNSFIRLHSGQYNIQVTPNHRMLVGTGRRTTKMKFINAIELPKVERFRLPISATCINNSDIPITDDELKFIAWFMTDGGWVRKFNQIGITQSKPQEKVRIRELLKRLKFGFGEYERANSNQLSKNSLPVTRFHCWQGTRKNIKGWDHLRKYLDKNLSLHLLKMSRRQFIIFWEELLHGDGNNDKRETRRDQLYVYGEVFLSRLQALAIISGFATNSTSRTLPSGKIINLMSISDRKFLEIKPNDKRRGSPSVMAIKTTKKKVWCVQNKFRTLIVRRHGSVAVVGNCLVMARPTLSSGLYLQAIGRVLRISEGKEKAFLLDLTDNTDRFGIDLDNVTVNIPKSVANKSSKFEKKCPECFAVVHPSRAQCPECNYEWPAVEIQSATTIPGMNDVVFGDTEDSLDVDHVEYFRHAKPNKIPSVRVEYHSDGYFRSRLASEWICVEHEGYARQKAEEWWHKITRGDDDCPKTVDEFLDLTYMLSDISQIKVKRDGKYLRVVDHVFKNKLVEDDASDETIFAINALNELYEEDHPIDLDAVPYALSEEELSIDLDDIPF